MIAFWVGMFAVVMLLLMCFEPRGGGYRELVDEDQD